MNKNMLISKMKLFGDTNENLAEYIGISASRFSAKINEWNGAEFTQGEIAKIKEKYTLQSYEIDEIFFNQKKSY